MIENEKIDETGKGDIIIDRFLMLFSPPFGVPETALKISWLAHQQTFKDYKIDSDSIKLYIELMIDEGLVCLEKDSTDKYVLTTLGRRIKRHGGWLKYLEQKRVDKKNQRKNIKASIRTNKSVRMTNKIQIISAVMTALIIGFGLIVSYRTLNLQEKQIKQDSLFQDKQLQLLRQQLELQNLDSTSYMEKDRALLNKGKKSTDTPSTTFDKPTP